jgi:serine protease Do
MKLSLLVLTLVTSVLAAHAATPAQDASHAAGAARDIETHVQSHTSDLLRQFDGSLVALAKRVSPAVVQIMVTGYGPAASSNRSDDVARVVRQHAIGSGVIVDPNGYIITNAHVIQGAQRIRIALTQSSGSSPLDTPPVGEPRIFEAKLIGADKNTDLALLKVDAQNLPVLPLGATRPVSPGELVLAIGSPEGLGSSVTMGVVSATWRQPNPNEPMAYIQTDAPINPGNSGGPLVDLDGYVVGLNTFILSQGGGSEGLGFAIPAPILRFVYEDLRKYGHVHRVEIQASAQEITPTLAAGLGLAQDWGVIISDVSPQGPGAAAGLKMQDIVSSVDGRQITGLPRFAAALALHPSNQPLLLNVLRGSQKISLIVPAVERHDTEDDLADFIEPQNLIAHLGVFVHDLDGKVCAVLGYVRIPSGVVVVAQSPELNSYTSSLQAGDILHSLNQAPIDSVQQLRSMLQNVKPGEPIVLQIERTGKLQYVAFDWND